jgi:NifU-like protein
VPIYPVEIAKLIEKPKKAGAFDNCNGVGREVNLECGCFVEVSISVRDGKIEDVRYATNGCGYMIAYAETTCVRYSDADLSSLNGLAANGHRLERDSPFHEAAPRGNCFGTVTAALRSSLADHRDRVVEEFSGEKALVCTCFGVTEDEILSVIETNNAKEVSDVSAVCKAGIGCGLCRFLIQEYIDLQ